MRVLPTTPRLVLVWLLGLVLVAGLVVVGWTWRHPQAFREGGAGTHGGESAIGVPVYYGMTWEEKDVEGSMTIKDLRANVVSDTAESEIGFFVCVVDGSQGIGAIGSLRGDDIEKECLSLVPAEGAVVELGRRPMHQVVMSVTPTQPGRVKIEGMDLTYRYGWRTGTQHIGDDIGLSVARR